MKNTFELIYDVVCQIPPGRVATYGQVAMLAGNPLHANPRPGQIPCHRVVDRFGRVSSAFAFGGQNRQIELLQQEGVEFTPDGRVDLKKYGI